MKIRPVGAELFHVDGRKDIKKLIVAFLYFAKSNQKKGGQIRNKELKMFLKRRPANSDRSFTMKQPRAIPSFLLHILCNLHCTNLSSHAFK